MFYNGFNLLIDLILMFSVGAIALRVGRSQGYAQGFDEAQWWQAHHDHLPDDQDEAQYLRMMSDEALDTPDERDVHHDPATGETWVRVPF